jgi:hypothetical protein
MGVVKQYGDCSLGHCAGTGACSGIDHTRGCLYNCLCPRTTPTMGTGKLTWSLKGRPVGDSPIVYRAHRDISEGGWHGTRISADVK